MSNPNAHYTGDSGDCTGSRTARTAQSSPPLKLEPVSSSGHSSPLPSLESAWSSAPSPGDERSEAMYAPIDRMKLGVSSHGFLEKCRGSSRSSFTTAWSASCSARRNRETRMLVMLTREHGRRGEYAVCDEREEEGEAYGRVNVLRKLFSEPGVLITYE